MRGRPLLHKGPGGFAHGPQHEAPTAFRQKAKGWDMQRTTDAQHGDPGPPGPVAHRSPLLSVGEHPANLHSLGERRHVRAAGAGSGVDATRAKAAPLSRGTAVPLAPAEIRFPRRLQTTSPHNFLPRTRTSAHTRRYHPLSPLQMGRVVRCVLGGQGGGGPATDPGPPSKGFPHHCYAHYPVYLPDLRSMQLTAPSEAWGAASSGCRACGDVLDPPQRPPGLCSG